MEPNVQYATTRDGVNIAFWAMGEGPLLIQMPAIPWSHCLAEWQDPDWRAWFERLMQNHRLVRFDGRGMGLSDRSRTECSLETMQLDLEAVIERLGAERVDIAGGPMGGPPAIAYAAAHPERVGHLLLWCSFAQPADWRAPQLLALTALARADWTLYTETLARAMAAGWDEGSRGSRFAALCRQAATPEAYESMIAAFARIDVREYLPQLRVPTLVMHRDGLLVPNTAVAQSLAANIPDARLAIFEGNSLLTFIGDMEAVARSFDEFTLGEGYTAATSRAAALDSAHVLRIILSSDMVQHTTMMQELGDDRGREVLREHERITRRTLAHFGGDEVKSMGDGFLISFGSAQRALECAIAMQREFAKSEVMGGDAEMQVRIGINAGEPIAENDDLYGASVITATRIAGMADGGEILISNVVRELAAGKGFLFADRGDAARVREI